MVSIALLQAGSSWPGQEIVQPSRKEGRRVKLLKKNKKLLLTVICPILPHLTTEISKPPSVYSQPTQCIIPSISERAKSRTKAACDLTSA